MSKQRSFRLSDGRIADIPDENVSKLLELDPKAVEVKSFLLDKDTVDIPIENADKFIKLKPDAKPLYEEEPSIGESMLVESAQKPFGAPEPSVPDNIDFASTKKVGDETVADNIDFKSYPQMIIRHDLPHSILEDETTNNALKVVLDNINADNSKLKTQDKQALNTVMPTMPLNVLTNRKSREVFYNTYASKQKLNVADVREYGERVTAERVLQLAQDALSQGDLESAESLANSQLKTRSKDAKAIIANIANQYYNKGDRVNADRLAPLPQVGTGSYLQPSYTPTTLGFSGKQGATTESNGEIIPDTQETEQSKYIKGIAETLEKMTPGHSQVGMIESGLGKIVKAGEQANPNQIGDTKNLSALLNLGVGLGETALGAVLAGTPAGAANFQPFEVATNYLPEDVSGWLMPVSHAISKYYDGKPSEDAQNVGFVLDTALFMLLHKGYNAVKKGGQLSKPLEFDEKEVAQAIKASEERLKQYGGNTTEYREAVMNDNAATIDQMKEASHVAEGLDAHANTTDYEPIPHPESLGAIPEGYDVEYQGRKGTIDRGDDGTWYFNDDATGESEQIPVKDKFNPQETLNDLDIQILPEVPQEQVAKAMADAERTGWVEEKGKRYFVSLGNPKIEGSFDMVFEQTPDGKLVNRFDSHPDQTFAQNRKLKIANKLLEEQGLPKRESLRAPRQSEPTSVVESAVTEPVSEAKAVQKVTADTEPTPDNSIYYHATDNDHIIAPGEEGYKKREGKNVVDQGIYFGKDKEHLTDRFGKNAIKVSLDIKNPLISDNQYIQVGSRLIDCLSLSKDDIKFLKRKGYDAVHLRLAKDGYYAKWNETIVFDKSQIKQLRVEPADPITPQIQETPSVEADEVVQEPAAVEAAEITPTEESNSSSDLKEMADRQVSRGKGSWRDEFNKEKDPFRKSSILRAIADGSKDTKELSDIREAAKGMPEESNIIHAVELKEQSLKEQGEPPAAESTEQPLTPKQEKIAKKNEILKDIRQYNSIPKRERATVGANLKAKIEVGAKEIGHTVAFDSKSRLSMFDAKGKKANASPRVISAEERQMTAERKAAVKEAMRREPTTIREYLLQYLLGGKSLSAESVRAQTGFEPGEFAPFTVSKDGMTLHDFMEMMDNKENEHLLTEMKDDGFIDTEAFNKEVMDALTSLSHDRGKLWEELLNGNQDNAPNWKKEGFQNEAEFDFYMEQVAEAKAAGMDYFEYKEKYEADANAAVDLLTDEEVDAILKDLDERSPKTEQEINQFYEDNDINTETEVGSETNNTERNKGSQTAEKELADAKQALIDKRAELTKALMEDQENLFGERKSSEGTLIDERADASQVEKALEPYKQAVEEAKAKLDKVEEPAKGQSEISNNGGKTAEFNHAGQDRTGVIVGEESGKYIIESKVGDRTNTYKIPKEKTTVLEDKSVEEILQARKNLSNIGNSTSGIAFSMPSDMFDSVGKSLKKLFNNTGGLPRKVFGFKVGMEGAKAATMFDIKVALNKLDSSVKTSYGKKFNDLTATEVTKMDKYLKGDTTVALPTDVKIALNDMRNQVDALSRELIASGLAEGDLALTIDKNLGTYLTRSYRAFDDPNWAKTVPESIRNQAKGYLRNEYPLATPAEIDGIIESLLYKPDAPIQILSGGKVGAKDLSIFKKRGDIPFEIRQLLGEYSDPKINYAKSVFKMAGLIEHSKFLEKTYQEGLNSFLFEKPTGQFHVQIAADTNKAYNPLSGLYTTPELADAFNQVKSVMKGDDLWNKMFRSYMTVNAAIKAGKTIGSVQTHVRNVLSNINFVVANAHIMYPEGAKKAMSAIKTMWKEGGTQEQIDYVKKLQRYGILDDGATAMELSETIKDASKKYSDVDQLLQDNVISKIKKGTVKAYALEDAMYKVFAFEAEKTRYEEAGVPDAEAIAARNVRNLYPTYSLTPEIVKQLRRVPLMGTFVSFPAEVIRTYANTWQLAAQEMRNPQTRSIGIKRVAGLIAATVLTKAISQQSRKLWNVSQQEEKDLRRFQPPWSESSDYVYVGRDKQNVPVYVDLGYSDPYNYLKNPINSIMFNEDQGEGAIKGFYNLVQPFISEEMLSSRMIDISRNKKSNGGQIYNEQDLAGDKLAAAWSYLADVAEPGTLGSIRRIYKGYKNEESDYGKKYDVDTEILAMMTGQRINNTNVKSALSFKTYSFSKDMQEAKRIYNSVAYKTKDKDEIEGAYIRANEARQKIYDKYVKLYNSALKLGMTQKEIKAVMKENNISGEMVRSIMANDPYKAFEKKVIIK